MVTDQSRGHARSQLFACLAFKLWLVCISAKRPSGDNSTRWRRWNGRDRLAVSAAPRRQNPPSAFPVSVVVVVWPLVVAIVGVGIELNLGIRTMGKLLLCT